MKMKVHANIDAYIRAEPKEIQTILQKIRATIKKAAPKATEAIKYGMPCFILDGNLVFFAAYKTHIGFYPGSWALESFKKDLKGYSISKGTVRFDLDGKIPYGLLTRIVKFRVKENREVIGLRAALKKKRSKKKKVS